MKFNSTLPGLFILVCFLSYAAAQGKPNADEREFPYVEVVDCLDCGDLAISLPTPVLPKPLDVFPNKNLGKIMVQIFVDTNGNVEKATAITGHPFFRPILEEAALRSRFHSRLVQGKPEKFKATIVYRIVSEEDDEPAPKPAKIGIVNGMASFLPIPEFPTEARALCAHGRVEVEVLIDESGRVISAKAISGNELLQYSAVAAARKARFTQTVDATPIKKRGIVVYNFASLSKCVNAGIVNKKAKFIPKPFGFAKLSKSESEHTVMVRIVIDEVGDVIRAKAISGNHLLRPACEFSALHAKFPATLIDPGPVKVSAILVYRFRPDGSIEY